MWWGSEGPGQVLKQHLHTLPGDGRRKREYLPQNNSEEDRSQDRRQWETSQRQGACCRHGPNAGTDRCERKPGLYQRIFCVRAKGEWGGWWATTPMSNPWSKEPREQVLGLVSCRSMGLLEMGLG